VLANTIDRWEAEILLAEVTDADRLAEAGDWIVDSATTDDFLSRLGAAGS